jgi:hypothetical protein
MDGKLLIVEDGEARTEGGDGEPANIESIS